MSFNVAGLNNKLVYGKFFSYINKFDIVFLYETHIVEEKITDFDFYFRDFKTKWIGAKRAHNIGRASGGCLLAFKRAIEKKI